MEDHKRIVAEVAAQVKKYYNAKEPFRINHGSTNSTRPKSGRLVDISALKRVLHVDKERKIALVEPNVPMDRLVEATLDHGLVPPVVMEFPGITAGGGYAGTAGESSSFKHGYFDRTINSVEMVLGNGDVVIASRDQYPDLFHGAAGAVGTLGITTLIELQLTEAMKYVKTTYHRTRSNAEAISLASEKTKDTGLDYVDGILYSKEHGAVITGEATNELPAGTTVQCFSARRDPWFYLHVQERTRSANGPVVEYIPLPEYLFRYDRGGFWVGASAFKYFYFPANRYTRWFVDDFLHTRMMYTALHASGHSKRYVVQDLALPYETAESFIDYTVEDFNIWPLWLCPLQQSELPTFHPHNDSRNRDGSLKPLLNIGVWGDGPAQHDAFIAKNVRLERKLRELGGTKWFYAHTYYSEEEFWQIYDRKWYEDLRKKYYAESLPTVYQKVRIDVEAERRKDQTWSGWVLSLWPFSGLWGIWKAILSGSYIDARKARWRVTAR